jgi:hypothetical protein
MESTQQKTQLIQMMMMMMIRKTVLAILLLGVVNTAFSQKDDFGIWYSVSGEHKFSKRLELDTEANLRTYDKASKIDVVFLEAGLTFKIFKDLQVGAGYRPEYQRDKDDTFHPRHKWFVEAKGTLPLGDLTISARARFEERYKTYYLDENDMIPAKHGRYRLKAYYNIPKFPVNPFIYAEIFCPMFKATTKSVDKARYACGAEYDFAKKQSFEVYYMFQRDYLPHLNDLKVISLTYNFRF